MIFFLEPGFIYRKTSFLEFASQSEGAGSIVTLRGRLTQLFPTLASALFNRARNHASTGSSSSQFFFSSQETKRFATVPNSAATIFCEEPEHLGALKPTEAV
jgi:hypothetical protein